MEEAEEEGEEEDGEPQCHTAVLDCTELGIDVCEKYVVMGARSAG